MGAASALVYSSPASARFRFQGDLSGSYEFNSNINSSSTDVISDQIWTVTPTATLTEFNANHSLAASFSFSTRRYLKTTLQDRDTYTGGLTGHYNLSRGTTLDFYETLSYTPEVTTQTQNFAPTFTDAGIVTALITRQEVSKLTDNDLGGTLTHQLTRKTRVSVTGKFHTRRFSSKEFDDSDDSHVRASLGYNPTKRDRFELAAAHKFYSFGDRDSATTTDVVTFTWNRDITKKFRSRVKIDYIDDSTKTFGPPETTTGSKSAHVAAGGTYDIDPNTQVIFLAGLNFSRRTGNAPTNQTDGNKSNIAPIYDIKLTRRFVHSNLSLKLRQTFNAGFSTGFDTTYEGISYTYEFTPDLTADLNVSRSISKSTGGNVTGADSIDTNATNVYVRLNYKIDRRTFFSVSLANVDQKSKGGGVGSNVKQRVLIFSLDLLDLNHRRP